METLRAYWTSTGYVVDYTGTEHEAEIQALFGTPVLPTPFTAQCPASEVQAELQAGNPEYKVEVYGDTP